MEVKYKGIVAECSKFKYCVKNNNKANIIIFKIEKKQETITLDTRNRFYIKVQNSYKTYIDKDPKVSLTEDETYIYVSWQMLVKATRHKSIDLQVQYEDANNSIVWQTAMINVDLHGTIEADKEIENVYPNILMDLQKQINDLNVAVLPVYGGIGIKVAVVDGKQQVSIDDETVALKEDLDSKVDKVEGKDLSTNDYTDEDKSKLDGISPEATKVVVLATTPNGHVVINGNQVRVFNDQELRNLIAGKETGWVIDRQDQITGDKDEDDNYNNVTAIEGLDLNQIKVGDNVYIKDREVPDYWVSARTEGSVGVILELTTLSTKIDLTNYFTKQEVINLLANYALDNTVLHITGNETIDGPKRFEINPKTKRGSIVARIPEEYQEVESLLMNSDSTNSTYIDFGISWKSASKIVSKVKIYANNTSTMVFTSGGTSVPYIALNRCSGLENPIPSSFTNYTDLAWHDFEITFIASSTNNICTSKYDGTWAKKISYGETKIYDVNNELLIDAIPCIRRKDEVAGFYDLISGTFLSNSGIKAIVAEKPLDTFWHSDVMAVGDIVAKELDITDIPLSAIIINGKAYRLIEQGITSNSYPSGGDCGIAIGHNSSTARAHGIAIGQGATSGNANTTIAVGNSALASGPRATAFGYGAKCYGYYSAALGPISYNVIKYSTTFDGQNSPQYFHMLNPSYLFFRYENQETNKVNITDYINGKSLQDLLDEKQNALPPLPADAATKTYALKAVNGVFTWVEE